MNRFISNSGIGDIIHSHQLLTSIHQGLEGLRNFEFIIGTAGSLGNFWATERLPFLVYLTNRLFKSFGATVLFSDMLTGAPPSGLLNNTRAVPDVPDLRSLFPATGECINPCQGKTPYVVITTKVRGLHLQYFEQLKPYLANALNNLANYFRLALIGEREIEYNAEYKIHGSSEIYSIYDFLKHTVPDADDFTVPALGISPTNVSIFERDVQILQHAQFALCLGSGGNTSIAASFAPVICLYDGREMGYLFRSFPISARTLITTEPKLFFARIEERLTAGLRNAN